MDESTPSWFERLTPMRVEDLTPEQAGLIRRMNPTLLPIQESAGLHLVECGHGDDARFARLFRQTWRAIPLRDRRWMIDWWRAADRVHDPSAARLHALMCGVHLTLPDLTATTVSPRVELVWGWRDRTSGGIIGPPKRRPKKPVEPRGHLEKAFGMVFGNGHHLRFRAGAVDAMPDAGVRDLIAHELAHVFQFARGWTFPDTYECEADADERMQVWGFDDESVDHWAVEAGIARVIEFDTEVELLTHLFTHGSRTIPPSVEKMRRKK